MSEFWRTAISRVGPGEILVRGYPIEQLTQRRSFGDVFYLLLKGELPSGNEGKLVEAILVSCCEHSLASPSVDAVRFVASCGVPLQTAVAAGISAIGDVHGGAIEPCAVLLQNAIRHNESADHIVARAKASGARLAGFGHPVHREGDPRTRVLLELAGRWGLMGPHTRLAQEVEASLERSMGRKLPLNVDGIIAALICDMGIDPALGKAFFITGRSPGYAAHAFEQIRCEPPFKAPAHTEVTYTGPERRAVPERHAKD